MNLLNGCEYKGYRAAIDFDTNDGIFIGEVFGIADSLNFHAASVDELQIMFKQSVDHYLELCKAVDKVPDAEQ